MTNTATAEAADSRVHSGCASRSPTAPVRPVCLRASRVLALFEALDPIHQQQLLHPI